MNRNEILALCAVLLVAFGLRFYDLSYPAFTWGDESAIVPAATNYWNNGQSEPDRWEHPPLRHVILYGFIWLFGDNPYGWRMMNVLSGSVAAALTFLLARQICGDTKTGLLAGLLLATDPLHLVLSRYPADEIYGSALFLAAVVVYFKHNGRSALLLLSASFAGCAIATKWNYVPGWFLLSVLALRENNNYRDVRTFTFITLSFLLLPLSIYILSFYQWFGRGYSLAELAEFTVNAYYSLKGNLAATYTSGMIFLTHVSAAEWFTRPVIVGQGTYLDAGHGEFILFMNSLPIWILAIPAIAVMIITAIRKKSVALATPGLFFFGNYVLYLSVERPVFIYSAAPLLPFAFTAIAYVVSLLANGKRSRKFFYAVLAVMIAWNLYLFPLATAKKVDVAPYRAILNNADIQIH